MKFLERFDIRNIPEPNNWSISFWVTFGVVIGALITLAQFLAGGG